HSRRQGSLTRSRDTGRGRDESAQLTVNTPKRERRSSELMFKASHTLSNENKWRVPRLLIHCAASANWRRPRLLPLPCAPSTAFSASTSTASIRRSSPDDPTLLMDPKY